MSQAITSSVDLLCPWSSLSVLDDRLIIVLLYISVVPVYREYLQSNTFFVVLASNHS